MMKTKQTHKKSKIMKVITMPTKALAKARDFYVQSMNTYADKVYYYGGAGWGASVYADPLPRRFSSNSTRSNDNSDFKHLVTAASTTGRDKIESALKQKRELQEKSRGVSRSATVGMAKIDEDRPCEFGDIGNIGMNFGVDNNTRNNDDKLFPTSRSYAVGSTKRSRVF